MPLFSVENDSDTTRQRSKTLNSGTIKCELSFRTKNLPAVLSVQTCKETIFSLFKSAQDVRGQTRIYFPS